MKMSIKSKDPQRNKNYGLPRKNQIRRCTNLMKKTILLEY